MKNENWLPVTGYEGLYEISDHGRVKSIRRNIILKMVYANGYLRIGLSKNCIRKALYVHRLVGICFIDNPLNLEEINHKDSVKDNNHVDNLEWMSHLENMQHAAKNDLTCKGEKHCMSKLTKEQVLEMRGLRNITQKEISLMYGISRGQVSRIIHHKLWKHI